MAVPSMASATALRLKRQLPVYRESARRLVAEAGAALVDAKKADAKSCLSFYGRLIELSKTAATLRTPTESVFDDAEAIVKHRKDLPEADGLLRQVRQLSELLDELAGKLHLIEREARRIGDKSALLRKVKLEGKDAKFEAEFVKQFDAGMGVLGVFSVLLLFYRGFAARKSRYKV